MIKSLLSSFNSTKRLITVTSVFIALIGWEYTPQIYSFFNKLEVNSSGFILDDSKENSDENAVSEAFLDITNRSGLSFVHFNGTTGEYLLPEITGSGGALFDFDNDGDLDLYIVQGAVLKTTKNPNADQWKGKSPPQDKLFRNDTNTKGKGKIKFTDVTSKSGITARGYGMGVATGDYNRDGWIDLYVTNLGSNQLFRNNKDGTFTDVTKQSKSDDSRWSTSVTFFDYDKDGWLDLFIANYVDFSISMKRECFTKSSALDYCGPKAYDPTGDKLLHNLGNGTFEDVTIASGISKALGAGLGVITADFNGDGWTDLFVANDGDYNQLWINKQGSGEFEDKALLGGVAVNYMGQAEASMGVTAADFDSDGDEDLFMTHLNQESNTFYINIGNGLFEDGTIRLGLHAPSLRYTSFGTRFFDYDNDGWLDLFVLNGAVRIVEALAKKRDPFPLHQPNQLFHNNGKFSFDEVTKIAGSAFSRSEVSRGASVGDLDNDGDADVVIYNNNGSARILQNQVGNQNHWLGFELKLKDNSTSTQALIEVHNDEGVVLRRRAHTDGSYCSASDPRILIGLGDSNKARTVRVHWPSGQIEQFTDLDIDRYWILQPGKAPIEP